MRLKSLFYKRHGRTYPVKCSQNKSRHLAVKSTLSEYIKKSTVHGVAYVGDGERNCFERIWWFIILICSVFCACYLIYQAYRTMKENPIIESPSLTRTSKWEIPFPAVTFCLQKAMDFTSLALDIANWPDFSHELLPENLTTLVDLYDTQVIVENLVLRESDQDNYEILIKVLPEIKITNSYFGYLLKEISFQKTITRYGACITFNMYEEKELLRDGVILSTLRNATDRAERSWDRDSGFNNNLPLENYTYPMRSFVHDDSLLAGFEVNDSERITQDTEGFLMIFHAPDELPVFGQHREMIGIDSKKMNFISIRPRLVASEGIEHYEPEVRKCYFSNERYLKFYKGYTQNHCEMECLANYTLAQCGCIPYYLPHLGDTILCTADMNGSTCVVDKSIELYAPKFKDNIAHAPIDDCNCLESCTQLSYQPEGPTTNDMWPNDTRTLILIEYNSPHISKNVRTEFHGISEFFSNCGGSLGLFLGVSVFSIVEFVYFCTIRLYFHSKRDPATR